MKQANLQQATSQINRLYITYRKEFLEQTRTTYITQKFNLTDAAIKQHLEGTRTLGLKLGSQGLTKFLVFDIDMKEKAPGVAIDIARHLVVHYGIDKEEVHISFSGGKGYHITLFFDEVVQDTTLMKLYNEVLLALGLDKGLVEFRPTSKQGVKLPLGIHRKTNNYMSFCSYDLDTQIIEHLSQEESLNYFIDIQPTSLVDFKELVLDELEGPNPLFSLKDKQATEFESIMSEINLNGKTIEDIQAEIIDILENKRLMFAGTRNRATFLLSMFFKEQGYELDETIQMIEEVLINTYDNEASRQLISADTTREFMLSEVGRVSNNTYNKGYSLSTKRREIEISKDEILQILEIKEKHLKQLAFTFLIHSKRHAKKDGSFYLTYSTLGAMGNTLNHSMLSKYIRLLEDRKLIEIQSSNQIDSVQSRLQGSVIKKPNTYRVLIEGKEKSPKITLRASDKVISYQELTLHFFSFNEIKHLIPRGQQESFKELLSKTV